MAIKKYKPTSPGRRFMTVTDYSGLSKTAPERSLLVDLRKSGGRNAHGRITVRHRGGGNKRKYRIIDFKRTKDGIPAKVATIEYDPNRTCFIALIHYADGEKSYILAPHAEPPLRLLSAFFYRSLPAGTPAAMPLPKPKQIFSFFFSLSLYYQPIR